MGRTSAVLSTFGPAASTITTAADSAPATPASARDDLSIIPFGWSSSQSCRQVQGQVTSEHDPSITHRHLQAVRAVEYGFVLERIQ